MLLNMGKTLLTLDFFFKKKIQDILVQSSIKEADHLALDTFGTLDGRQISLCTKVNGIEHLLLRKWYDAWKIHKHHNKNYLHQ